jgi:Sec-independent protein translocase protein TatA
MLLLSPAKLLVVLVVALIVLGPDKLPKVANQVGALWHDLQRWRSRLEQEVRGAFPDLPPTHEIARAVRSPLSLLDHLVDSHETVAATTGTATADGTTADGTSADGTSSGSSEAGPGRAMLTLLGGAPDRAVQDARHDTTNAGNESRWPAAAPQSPGLATGLVVDTERGVDTGLAVDSGGDVVDPSMN